MSDRINVADVTRASFMRELDRACNNPKLTPAQLGALKLRAHMLGLTRADVIAEDFRKEESQ